MVDLNDVFYPFECEIVARVETTGTSGQPEYADGTVTSGVRCDWQPRGRRERAGRGTYVVQNDRLYFPWGTAIDESMRVRAITRASDDTSVAAGPFNVTAVSPCEGDHLEVDVEAVR